MPVVSKPHHLLFMVIGLVPWIDVNAQHTTSATGGEASGSGGTANYTVGQVFFETHDGNGNSVAEGVHQPYEISTTIGVDDTAIRLETSIYPNPTRDQLTLSIEDGSSGQWHFKLVDMHGRLLEERAITLDKETIHMQHLSNAIYLLEVSQGKSVVKAFQIVKQ